MKNDKKFTNSLNISNLFPIRKNELFLEDVNLIAKYLKDNSKRKNFLDLYRVFSIKGEISQTEIEKSRKELEIEQKEIEGLFRILELITHSWLSGSLQEGEIYSDLKKIIPDEEIRNDIVDFIKENQQELRKNYQKKELLTIPIFQDINYKILIETKKDILPTQLRVVCQLRLTYINTEKKIQNIVLELKKGDLDYTIKKLLKLKEQIKESEKIITNIRKE